MPILAAYNEIALKSRYVRSSLERKLASQIQHSLRMTGYSDAKVRRLFGRIIADGVDSGAAKTVSKVFGVANAFYAENTGTKIEEITELAVKVAELKIGEGNTFAVRPKVVGDHPYGSREVAVEVGSAIMQTLKDRGIKVNLTKPDVTIYIEAREDESFIYSDIIPGVGGLPYGTQGNAVALFSGGIDSPVAAWLMMKRGVAVHPLFMDQTPFVGESYLKRVDNAFRAIRAYAPVKDFHLYSAPINEIMARLTESPEPKFTCVLCKRSMYRIAEQFGQQMKAAGIITGESLGQVASQTLDNIFVLSSAVKQPILRPLIGLDKVEIEDIARRIGTYEITAKKVEGCTVVPSSPATTSKIEKIEELEHRLDLKNLCMEAAEKIVKREAG